MTTTTAHVTQDLIDWGKRSHPCRCPVANAIRELVDPKCFVSVTRDVIVISMNCRDWQCKTPEIALDFIRAFDADYPVSPISFPLEGIPPELLRRAA